MWTTITGKMTGPYHLKKGEESQDSMSYYTDEDLSLIAVADGAGSHENSKEGSQLVVDYAIQYMKEHVEELGIDEELIEATIEECHKLLRSQDNFKSMGCTLAIAASDGLSWAAGVVGDAFAVIHLRDGEHKLVQPVKDFEFANVTELLSGSEINPAVESGMDLIGVSVSTDGLLHKSVSDGAPLSQFWNPLVDRGFKKDLDLNNFFEYMSSKHFIDDDTTLVMSLWSFEE